MARSAKFLTGLTIILVGFGLDAVLVWWLGAVHVMHDSKH